MTLLIWLGLLVGVSQATELDTVMEYRANTRKATSRWYMPTLVWGQTSLLPVQAPTAESISAENYLGLSFKAGHKKKISFNMGSLHNGKESPEMGDAFVKYSDKSFQNIFADTDLVLTHKLLLPFSQTSQERQRITSYKGQYYLDTFVAPGWHVLYHLIPTIHASEVHEYTNAEGKKKYNKIYEVTASAQTMYEFTQGFFLSFDNGLMRSESYNGKEDTLLSALSLITSFNKGQISVALGAASEVPTSESTLRSPQILARDFTSYFLETYITVF